MNPSKRSALAALGKARLSGCISACFFLLVVLLLIDGLQALMRTDFNQIEIALGGQVLISGAMPLQAKGHADLTAIIEGNDGLSFTPLTSFTGLWFGAHMWRGALDASNAAEPGRAMLTILDMVPAKSTSSNATIMVQNPSQIYSITVWPTEEALQAAHASLSRRLTGLSAFLWAGGIFACGIGMSIWHFFLNRAAHRALAEEGIFLIYAQKETEAGYQTQFSPGDRQDLQAQQPMLLLTPQGVQQGKGVLSECSEHKCSAFFPLDGAVPRYGWLVRYEPETRAALEHEEKGSA